MVLSHLTYIIPQSYVKVKFFSLGCDESIVIKLCYILSGVGSRVIVEGQKWDVMKANGGAL
jgi:hypothetical protein